MTQFRKKPVVITAITFDQLVAHGIAADGNVVNGMPWSFSYAGHGITHENDDCYLIPTLEGTMKMGRDDMLITGVKGEIYPCKRDIFEATYDAAPTAPGPVMFGDEEHVAVPRGLIGAACSVIDKKRDGTNTLAELRRYTFGDKSAALPQAASTAFPVVDPGPDSLEREIQAKADKGPRVTPAALQAEIVSEHYFTAGEGVMGAYVAAEHEKGNFEPQHMIGTSELEMPLNLLTFCVLVLRNGAKVVGVNYGAIDPAQHSAERGRQEARAQAEDKVYELLGFRLRDELARPVLTDADAAADLAGTPRPA